MIVRKMPDGQLLCINQTSHALMAEEFCRYWGNNHFAAPAPYSAVMLAIGQHDNGWYEWELAPLLREDGYPMDFIHDLDVIAKLALWRRGINRVYAQNPYAALLIGRHASWLYASAQEGIVDEEVEQHIAEFIADQQLLIEMVRYQLGHDPRYQVALTDEKIDTNSRLLQFGDSTSLQVSVPWGNSRTIQNCPFDDTGTFIPIQMEVETDVIHFEPWPYSVTEFEVNMEGKLLSERRFENTKAYHTALAEAPYYRQTWTVKQ